MASYYIPSNNLKGESRILYIFTTKSLLFTAGGAFIGLIFYFIFGVLLGLKPLGIGIMAILALLGYAIATIKLPTSGNSKIAKNVGGDSIDDVIVRYFFFKKNRKVYTYAVPRKEPDYASIADNLSMDKIIGNLTKPKTSTKPNTKEEK